MEKADSFILLDGVNVEPAKVVIKRKLKKKDPKKNLNRDRLDFVMLQVGIAVFIMGLLLSVNLMYSSSLSGVRKTLADVFSLNALNGAGFETFGDGVKNLFINIGNYFKI